METLDEANRTTCADYRLEAGGILSALEKFAKRLGLKLSHLLFGVEEENPKFCGQRYITQKGWKYFKCNYLRGHFLLLPLLFFTHFALLFPLTGWAVALTSWAVKQLSCPKLWMLRFARIAPHSIQLYMQKQYITHTSFAPYYGIHKGELEDLERVTETVTYLGPLSHIFCFNYVCTYVWGCMWWNGMHSVRPSTIQSHVTSSTRQLDPQPLWLQRHGLGGRSGWKNSWCWP